MKAFYWPSQAGIQSPESPSLPAFAPASPLSSSTAPPGTPAEWHCNMNTHILVIQEIINGFLDVLHWSMLVKKGRNPTPRLLHLSPSPSFIFFPFVIVVFLKIFEKIVSDAANMMWRCCPICNCIKVRVMEWSWTHSRLSKISSSLQGRPHNSSSFHTYIPCSL